jgi:hypothetical protein
MIKLQLIDPVTQKTEEYRTVLEQLATQIKTEGSKRSQVTSIKKLNLVIEEMATFINSIAFNAHYQSKNPLVKGLSLNQPLINKVLENNEISLHHNVVHDLLAFCLIRDNSYNNDTESGTVYCKTTVGFTPHFEYVLNNIDRIDNKEGMAYKLDQLNNGYKLLINSTLTMDQHIMINNKTYHGATSITADDNIAIIGRIDMDQLQLAMATTQKLIKAASRLKSDVIRTAKVARLRKNMQWIQTCIMNNGVYLDLYRLHECGRHYSIGISLQNINKDIRNIILKRHQAYDQKGSHLKIFQDIIATYNLNIPELNDYLTWDQQKMQNFLKQNKMRRKTLKTTILAILNGYQGAKIDRCDFFHIMFNEMNKCKKIISLRPDQLFNEERIKTFQMIQNLGLQNVLSLEFDGFSANNQNFKNIDPNWKQNTI